MERVNKKITLKERIIQLQKKEEIIKLVGKLQQQVDRVKDSMEIIRLYIKSRIQLIQMLF